MERAFTAETVDGKMVEVVKVWDGDNVVLQDADGNRYSSEQFGTKIVPIAAGEAVADPDEDTTGGETETVEETENEAGEQSISDPTPEEVEAGKADNDGADEDGAQGGATEEPVG